MATKHATYDIDFKALDEDGHRGEFEAIVSVFGNVDHVGDRVVKGAFRRTIQDWRDKADPFPILWSHDWGNPNAHIGYADPKDIEEVDKGLKIKGRLDLDNPFAAQVYRLLKERRVREFSFGYSINKERTAKDGAIELLDLDLIEAGPTLKGANPATELLAVKSDLEAAADETNAEVKAGRRISKETADQLSALADEAESVASRIRDLLSAGDSEEPKADEAEGKSSAESEDEAGKSDTELLTLKARILTLKGD